MSEAIAFDTHQFIKHLTNNGFTEQQAEALANEQVTLLNSNLATKTEIAAIHREIEALRLESKADIEKFRSATKADVAAIHKDTEDGREESHNQRKATETALNNQRKATEVAFDNQRKAMEAAFDNQWKATQAAFEIQRKNTEAALEAFKVELLKWMFGALIAQGGLIVGLIALISGPP